MFSLSTLLESNRLQVKNLEVAVKYENWAEVEKAWGGRLTAPPSSQQFTPLQWPHSEKEPR
ncbi:hypothetical protein N7537_009100 [Penicillium hordei]|uniref:Uncharacterized protein n=1 Tax=Penicillium hordei TaxID=40994 RepID=A0AAD6DS75_9EURO|nr:uncharacterized protein N7537_009100 [Penicillium hordei]KAJ5592196.1 hypothetical protein N7537_009100 [Penicillium hordei]